jgi:hypothetical protein
MPFILVEIDIIFKVYLSLAQDKKLVILNFEDLIPLIFDDFFLKRKKSQI